MYPISCGIPIVRTESSKLANLAGLQSETAEHSWANELELHDIQTPEIYAAMDWLFQRQTRIENQAHLRSCMGYCALQTDVR